MRKMYQTQITRKINYKFIIIFLKEIVVTETNKTTFNLFFFNIFNLKKKKNVYKNLLERNMSSYLQIQKDLSVLTFRKWSIFNPIQILNRISKFYYFIFILLSSISKFYSLLTYSIAKF